MKKVLFIVAHPHMEKSRVNAMITEMVADLTDVTVRPLYDLYPHFRINVAAEKKILEQHDLIVIQHPFYWYNMPALLKLWLDEVFEFGWAYGPMGNALRGKEVLLSVTTGGGATAYRTGGYNRFEMATFLAPWNQTAHICGLRWLDPVVFHSSTKVSEAEVLRHSQEVRQRILQAQRSEVHP